MALGYNLRTTASKRFKGDIKPYDLPNKIRFTHMIMLHHCHMSSVLNRSTAKFWSGGRPKVVEILIINIDKYHEAFGTSSCCLAISGIVEDDVPFPKVGYSMSSFPGWARYSYHYLIHNAPPWYTSCRSSMEIAGHSTVSCCIGDGVLKSPR